MIKFNEFLNEGRDAPLYHGTTSSFAVSIIEGNSIKAHTDHFSKKVFNNIDHKHPHIKNEKGISLTRDVKFALSWPGKYGIVFELDQRKLAQRHKLIPIKIEGVLRGGNRNEYAHMAEEFIIGDIKDLDKYLTKIIIKSETIIDRIEQKIIDHPLLYDYKAKRFINGSK
jgi:hypothetical protein